MESMAEAMKVALEHPIPKPPHKPRTTWKPKASAATTSGGSRYFWWGLAGSIAAALLLRRGSKTRSEWRARSESLASMDFGGD